MKIYIDFSKQAITKIDSDVAYVGDVYSNVFELLFFNYGDATDWFPTMSQLAPNGREAGDFSADALEEDETYDYVEDDITYKRYTFTIGDGWVRMKGRSNFFIWVNKLVDSNTSLQRKCYGKLMVTLNESTDNYFIQDAYLNPKVKEYIDNTIGDDLETYKATIDEEVEAQNETIASLIQASPSVFDTASNIQLLQENKGVAVATDTGYIYYWDSTLSTPAYVSSGLQYNSLATYTKHSGNQLQDENNVDFYPNVDMKYYNGISQAIYKPTLYNRTFDSSTQTFSDSTTRLITDYITFTDGDAISINPNYEFRVLYFRPSDMRYIGYMTDGWVTSATLINPNISSYTPIYIVNIRNKLNTSATITPNEVNGLITYSISDKTYLNYRKCNIDLKEKYGLVGDGSVDETIKLQNLIDNENDIINIPFGTYLITSLSIDLTKVKIFNGNNSLFKISGSNTGFSIVGNCTVSSASPLAQGESSYKNCNAIFENVKITSTSSTTGIGISLTNCFKLTVKNCYIYMLSDGIKVLDVNRDITFINNHIYGCNGNGLWLSNTANLHQCNVTSNMISYCHINVNFDDPVQIANFQFSGNDIELSSYPTSDLTTSLAVRLYSNSNTGLFGEIEFTGNTIQGHNDSNNLISIDGNNRYITNITFGNNNISNCISSAILLGTKIQDIHFSGNVYKSCGYVFEITGIIENSSIIGECASSVGGLLNATNTSKLNGLVISNNVATCSGTYNILVEAIQMWGIIIGNIFSDNASILYYHPTTAYKTVISNNALMKSSNGYDIMTSANVNTNNNI